MILGAVVVLTWVYANHDYKDWYEILPGFVCSFISIVIVSLLTYKDEPAIDKDFNEVNEIIKNS